MNKTKKNIVIIGSTGIIGSYLYEKLRFDDLSSRFDDLISLEGEQRFMKDQDQMISRDRIRVIWR